MPSRCLIAFLALFGAAPAVTACETALILSIDVSGSIDEGEYRLQADGIATALSDPVVAEALVRGQVALTVLQWSNAEQQAASLPWRRMLSQEDVAGFVASAAAMPRAFEGSDTAPGDMLQFASELFSDVSDCRRRVIDVSGDGQQNTGSSTAQARMALHRSGIIINGIAIEDMGASLAITEYYRRFVITPGGFVMTARGLSDYAETLRAKLVRELARPIG